MRPKSGFPSFDAEFEELDQFILTLVEEYDNGRIKSWDDLDARVKSFFTPVRNEGWSLFEPEVREQQYRNALAAFEKIEAIISS